MRSVAGNGRGQPAGRGAREGFLLVEVLATMTISAFLLAALFSIASFVIRASGRVENRSETIENRGRVLASLSREIEQIAPLRWAGKGSGFVFLGTRSTLAFASRKTSTDTGDIVQAVFLDAGRSGLSRRLAAVSPVATSFRDLRIGPADTVFGRQYSVAFAYYGRAEGNREALQDAWQDPSQLPAAIRITLRGADGTEETMRIQIRADAETGCAQPGDATCSLRPVSIAPEESATPESDEGADGG